MNTRTGLLRRRAPLRLAAAAGALGIALTAGVSACGTVDSKLAARDGLDNLKKAKAASFTLSFDDPKAELVAVSESEEDKKAARVAEESSLRIVVDPAGSTSLSQAQKGSAANSTDAEAALKNSGTIEISWSHKDTQVATLRMIDGVVYVRLDVAAYESATGTKVPLDAGENPMFATVLEGVKAGKWLRLDLPQAYAKAKKAGLLDKAGALTGGTMPQTLDPTKARALANDLLAAADVQKTVSADGDKTLVKYSMDAKSSLLKAIDVLAKPDYATLFGPTSSAQDLDSARTEVRQLPDGKPVTGTATVVKKHLTQLTVNLDNVAALTKDEKASQIKTARLVLDIDDTPKAVAVPGAQDVVSLDTLVDLALGGIAKSTSGGITTG